MDFNKAALEMHETHHGKVGIVSKVEVKTRDDLSTAYTPGVAEPCRKIRENPDDVYKYTFKSNMVAVVSNGTAVLGLGDIGPEAGLPVMEGKAVLFKEFGGVDAFPICIDAHDAASVIAACKAIAPTFGGINLEDIKSPECFEIEETLERELEWINMAPKARHAKGKARLNSYEALLNEDQKEREAKLEIFIPNGPRLGNKVIEAQHVAKAFGDKLLFDDLNFMLPPNGIVGVIGPNGAGKTTLFKMIMGMESIDKGTFEVGETVQVGYADQTHKDIDPKKTVYQVVSGGQEFIRMGGKEVNARAYLSKFNFAGADQEKLCGVLSGGERNRLHLALTLKADANVLLLDEPTNDIDVNTLRALEEGLENFAGCAVVVSHDRWFLDRICTHILSFEGDSNVVFYEGTYSEYEEYKRKTLGDAEPKRVRYRKLIVD